MNQIGILLGNCRKRAAAMQQIQTIYGMNSKKSFVMCCRIVGFATALGIYIDILI
jgi:hypothetical protein